MQMAWNMFTQSGALATSDNAVPDAEMTIMMSRDELYPSTTQRPLNASTTSTTQPPSPTYLTIKRFTLPVRESV